VVAIADGVSGWDSAHALLGIWARLMLETLSRLMTEYKLSHAPHTMNARDIKQVLDDSFLHTSHLMDLQQLGGSSTLVWGMLSGSTLKYVSIGDSRLFVVRNGLIVCTNTELAEDLYPQQIGTQTLNKLPSDMAVVDEFGLQEHDLVVVCSDGVTDNLFEWEILDLLQSHLSMETSNLRAVCSKILAQCKLAFNVTFITLANKPKEGPLPDHSI
jgi:serine/threonine protein phosphatase PrpC